MIENVELAIRQKIYWKTWKPKVEDVLLIDLTHTERNGKIISEIFQDVMDKEHPKKIKPTGIYKVRR
jgi:hypothetical protein